MMLVDYFDDLLVFDEARNKIRNRTSKEGFIKYWEMTLEEYCMEKYDDYTAREAVRMYMEGYQVRYIREALGINTGCIYVFLKMYGHQPSRNGSFKRVTKAEKELMIRMYKEGKSIYRIAKELNRSTETVWRILVKAGVHRPKPKKG